MVVRNVSAASTVTHQVARRTAAEAPASRMRAVHSPATTVSSTNAAPAV